MPRSRANRRLLLLGVVLALVWSVVGVRLFDIQVVRAAEYEELGLAQRLRKVELAQKRGAIYDREGRVLAFTVDSTSIYVHPDQVDDVIETALALSALLQLPASEVQDKLLKDASFVWIKRQVAPEVAQLVLDQELPGVYGTTEPLRVYPAGPTASHVIGFVNIDGDGIEGLEYQYNQQLAGRSGYIQYEASRKGVTILQGETVKVEGEPSVDIVTSIDLTINSTSEQACEEALRVTEGKRCSVVVLDPNSGEILSLVVTPGFDPDRRDELDPDALLSRIENLAIRSLFEPGSTMKLVTVAAALQEGVVTPDLQLEVPWFIEFEDPERPNDPWKFVDINRGATEIMSVRDIVARSSNVGTILIQERLGTTRQNQYLEAFGFGAASGVDYSGEPVGQVNVDPSCNTCGPSASIGYAVNSTLLQMATVFGVVANGGEWVQPHFVTEIHGPDGVSYPDTVRRRVLDEAIAATMRSLLHGVVASERGTGRAAAVEGYRVGGKTGTSRVFENGEYQDGRFNATFIGMAPIDDPRLVVAVLVEEPVNGYYGGQAAAPVFAEVMLKALHALGVEPDA